jgi:hypothetical protein
MKLKEILKNNVYSHFDGTNPTLSGSGLKALKPFFNDIEEFNGKTIEVIDTLDGLVTVKGVENLRENVKIQTLFLIDDDVFIRCTADSLKIESLYKTSSLEMGQIPAKEETNQTAVEWLAEQYNLVGTAEHEQAKLMEKEQKGYSEEEVELIANEMVNWAIDNIGNPNPQSGKKFDEVISKFKNK